MGELDSFRPLPSMDLRRVFTSLGLPITAFRNPSQKSNKIFLNAILNTDSSRPDGLWLFQGSNYFLYNLATGKIEDGPRPIDGNFGNASLPQMFRTGIHSAVGGGPGFPHLWFVFKDEWYVSLSSEGVGGSGDENFVPEQLWQVIEGPRGILGAWATGVWAAPDGSWLTPGVPVALYGMGSKFQGMIHFFKDGQYVRHNLNTGGRDAGPMPIGQAWNLPEEFQKQIDFCFYGTGSNEENIFFISGQEYVLYDFRQNTILDQGLVEDRFPAFAQFFGRPQLFLVEDYTLATFIGPTHLGRLIDTRSIGAGSTIKKILVTQSTDKTKTTLTKSLLESQENSVVTNFYDKIDQNSSASKDSEAYKYQLDANFHGDASADSLWGGEVNATLNVKGGTDTLRSSFSEAAFKSIQSQVNDAKKGTEQKTFNSADEISHDVSILRQDIFEERNDSDRIRVYEFYEQLQSYLTLLVLRHVNIGYSDGTDRPEVVELRALPGLLGKVLANADQQKQLTEYLKGELSSVADHEGRPQSLLDLTNPTSDLVLAMNLTTTYQVQKPDGTIQSLAVKGLIKADKEWVEPTYTIKGVQVED